MKKGFGDKFDELMDSIPSHIEEHMVTSKSIVNSRVSNYYSIESSTIINDGKEVKVETINGKTKVTVDGKEYVQLDIEEECRNRGFSK